MAQDRSRSAFDRHQPKHWSSLQAQQGRLLSDDDWNEADAIDKEDLRRTRTAIIGPSGTSDDGFLVSNPRTVGNEIDFDLAPGTMYVGGLQTTIEQTESFRLQKDWLQQAAADRPALGSVERIDLVYLEVWQQPVTAVEDDELREVALGGPDTSVRLRTMRRVHVRPNVATESCNDAWATLSADLGGLGPDDELPSDATLTVGYVQDASATPDLCAPSAQGGYLGAENQAIRVEIGSDGKSLLWGYDNASPLYRVQVTTDTTGAQVIHFLTTPRDEAHWPLAQQIVELLPWSAILPNGQKVAEPFGGHLAQVTASYDPNTQNIKVQPSVNPAFGTAWQARSDQASIGIPAQSYVYLRVWNRGPDVTSPPEIPFTVGASGAPGTPVPLIGTGLSVALGGSTFRPGDFWIIAARPESPARVVPWALEAGRLAEGTRRFFAPLGLIKWRPANSVHDAYDCRNVFEPLTRQRGCCIDVTPRSGWERDIDAVAGDQDVCICFQPGDYTTSRTLVFHNQNVSIHGAGRATRIHGAGLETVLKFEGCASVDIGDLSIESTTQRNDGKGAPRPHLAGAITVADCDHVSISNVAARCASGPVTSASCVALYSELPPDRVRASTARIEGCDLTIGANQVGLSVINAGRLTIADNSLQVDPIENAQVPPAWLTDKAYRRSFRRALIWRFGLGQSNAAGVINLTIGQTNVWIATVPSLQKDWQQVVKTRKLPKRIDHLTVGEYLNEIASDLVNGQGVIGTRSYPLFKKYIATLLGLRTSVTKVRTIAAQGIVVGGTAANDVQIVGNTIRDTVQGIHVGVSAHRPRNPGPGAPVSDTAGRVVVSNNAVNVSLMPELLDERHGIFVGNCQSLLVEDNFLACERVGSGSSRLEIDGIRAYGFMGRMAYITRNHIDGFTTGIRMAPLNNLADGSTSMWRVNENIARGAATTVSVKLKVGTATHVATTGNMS